MKSSEIEKALKNLTTHITPESFLFELLSIYDFPKASITRLKKGDGNLSKNEGEFLSKNKFLFKSIEDIDPHLVIDELGVNETLLKYRPRFLIVTNYKTFLAQDLKTYDSLDIPIEMLADNHEFFLPLMGIEKSKLVNEDNFRFEISKKEHIKGLITESCFIDGSMNLTFSGANINSEMLTLSGDIHEISEARIDFDNLYFKNYKQKTKMTDSPTIEIEEDEDDDHDFF